jgi:hypothetical protein
MSVSCEYCVFSGRGPASSSSVAQRISTECGVSECDHESSIVMRPWPNSAFKKNPIGITPYVKSLEDEYGVLFVLSKKENQKIIKRRRFCARNVCNKIIKRGEFCLLNLETLRYFLKIFSNT